MPNYFDPVEPLSQLYGRIQYLHKLEEERGPNRGAQAECEALTWCLDELAQAFPGTAEDVVKRYEEREARRAQRRGNR